MVLAFTICSVNYLAQARTLGDSLRQTNPEYKYIIGLVDRLDVANLPDDLMPDYPMVEVDKIHIPDFQAMCDRYDITELNTAVKPFFIDYFYTTYPNVTQIIYFDPDIIVYQPLTQLNQALDQHSILLTPHTCSPTPDWKRPNDQHHLNTGIFNLGFIGLRNDDTARQFVNWWKQRLVYECRIDLCSGMFVDQQWVNFAPVFHDNVLIDNHPGYNVAYWNIHERYLSLNEDEQWQVSDTADKSGPLLQFFHYSGYDPYKPDNVSKYQDRYTFDERPDIKPVFELYKERLLANNNEQYRKYPCVYIKPPKMLRYRRVRKAINLPFNQLISLLESI
ncbi:glycosyl transferase [Spirosoma sp. BT702]|uniref:Glycosyl transferase n=1 Tax=Spirosoma profusum TaxID=2771354 RepID=A0A926Y0W4_9BACT|nr:glycosyl transferase [Spirosoma profusum]MBD2704544.1 glycosyl transferase [Spirosoma profusum]